MAARDSRPGRKIQPSARLLNEDNGAAPNVAHQAALAEALGIYGCPILSADGQRKKLTYPITMRTYLLAKVMYGNGQNPQKWIGHVTVNHTEGLVTVKPKVTNHLITSVRRKSEKVPSEGWQDLRGEYSEGPEEEGSRRKNWGNLSDKMDLKKRGRVLRSSRLAVFLAEYHEIEREPAENPWVKIQYDQNQHELNWRRNGQEAFGVFSPEFELEAKSREGILADRPDRKEDRRQDRRDE
ncbi:hypothetical protein B0H13DRAFT_1904622 [Mycena leptocephala]|nr:hypothetical protein B0H13DRAFT_1904622 [Mycena leptocephala]